MTDFDVFCMKAEPPLGVIREQGEWGKVRRERGEEGKIRKEQGEQFTVRENDHGEMARALAEEKKRSAKK